MGGGSAGYSQSAIRVIRKATLLLLTFSLSLFSYLTFNFPLSLFRDQWNIAIVALVI